ncbi:Hypp8201 [Branchiostoma lanceolatum]|uniref:Hypp8201 protein n=1 Tax=Branchiostoma lanceolatum TaxID=7740 RepID=A0A8J9Z6B3_BRALA|nr:Hypp8201 [Branchiostoma lanceolatum]
MKPDDKCSSDQDGPISGQDGPSSGQDGPSSGQDRPSSGQDGSTLVGRFPWELPLANSTCTASVPVTSKEANRERNQQGAIHLLNPASLPLDIHQLREEHQHLKLMGEMSPGRNRLITRGTPTSPRKYMYNMQTQKKAAMDSDVDENGERKVIHEQFYST